MQQIMPYMELIENLRYKWYSEHAQTLSTLALHCDGVLYLVQLQQCLASLLRGYFPVQVFACEGKQIVGGHLNLPQHQCLFGSRSLDSDPLRLPEGGNKDGIEDVVPNSSFIFQIFPTPVRWNLGVSQVFEASILQSHSQSFTTAIFSLTVQVYNSTLFLLQVTIGQGQGRIGQLSSPAVKTSLLSYHFTAWLCVSSSWVCRCAS